MSNYLDRNVELPPFQAEPGDNVIICRCEEVTRGEIRRAVHEGLYTMAEIRRYLRCTMGLCQGQTCQRNVLGIVARELGVPRTALEPATSRTPMRPTEVEIWARDAVDFKWKEEAAADQGTDNSGFKDPAIKFAEAVNQEGKLREERDQEKKNHGKEAEVR